MEFNLPTEVILSDRSTLAHLYLTWSPQPGAYLEIEGLSYLVLERRHRYKLRAGRYHLNQISLYVQKLDAPTESSLLDGHWVVGDISCRYNAHSELLRCTVNPSGPCDRCLDYQSSSSESSY